MDIKADAAIHKGMPHKYYHGKTGRVWNVTQRAVGVEVNKRVGNRIIKKRIHVRVEHVRHSKSRQEFLDRVKENAAKKHEAKEKNGRIFRCSICRFSICSTLISDLFSCRSCPETSTRSTSSWRNHEGEEG